MADGIAQAKHREILAKVRGLADSDGNYHKEPTKTSCDAAADCWKDTGTQAVEVADELKKALDRVLDANHGGWKGDAADSFRKKVEQVIYFARQIAHRCDSENPEPSPPEGSDSDVFARDSSSGEQKSFRQNLESLGTYIESIQDEKHLPDYPWNPHQYGSDVWFDWGEYHYDIKDRDDGDKALTDEIEEGDWKQFMDDRSIGYDFSGSGIGGYFPKSDKDWERLFIARELNKDQEQTCRETTGDLITKYGEIAGQFADAPTAPQITGGKPGGPGGPGGPGAGGPGSGTPSFPDRPTTPEGPDVPGGPDRPDVPDPTDTDHDGIPDSEDKFPDDPTNDFPGDTGDSDGDGIPDSEDPFPNDPGGPDRDGDGIPDSQDPFPNNPDHDGDGIPDGQQVPRGGGGGGGGDVDTGTQTARTGPGGIGGGGVPGSGATSGSAGPSFGGAGAGVSTPSAGAAGVNPNIGAGAGMRGGMGGMMPMMGGGGTPTDGQEQERNTWLDEDEDVWGTDDDAPPPVLGG